MEAEVVAGMGEERTPPEVREGVRSGILASIKRDVELRGGHTARLLLAAGVVGVIGAIGATLLVSGHPTVDTRRGMLRSSARSGRGS